MSFRGGRGRGRGFRGGVGGSYAPQCSWEQFPEINDLGTAAGVVEKLSLAKSYSKLHSYWKSSPYFLQLNDANSKDAKDDEIERFSDMNTSGKRSKTPLSYVIRMQPEYVPSELARGGKTHSSKRRWKADSNPDSEYKWGLLEKQEHARQGRDTNEKKEEGEGEDEDDEGSDKEKSESSDEGDYEQNVDFDDDEDDFNPPDDDDDEPDYE